MGMPLLDRRSLLFFAGGAFLAGGRALEAAAPADGFALDDPQDGLMAMLRMQGRLDGADAPWWYFGRLYGVLPGRAPIPLVRFEGTEILRLTPAGQGEYAATGVTTSFFQDLRSSELLETMRNPVTGKTVQVEPNLIGGTAEPVVYFSSRGIRPGRVSPEDWPATGLLVHWDQYGDQLWMSYERTAPPGVPQPAGECSVMRALSQDLHDRARSFVPTGFSSTYFSPWPRWLAMDGEPGHVIWHADGLKLESVEKLPARFLGWMEQRYPERLAAKPYLPAAR